MEVLRRLEKIELCYDGYNYLINDLVISEYEKIELISLNDLEFYFKVLDEYKNN
jgi:hypothetical protein